MDHRAFWFANRGQCIKGKQCQHIAIKNKICVCVQNNLAYFPFMHYPLVANRKARWSIVYFPQFNDNYGEPDSQKVQSLTNTVVIVSIRFRNLCTDGILEIRTQGPLIEGASCDMI